MTSAPELEAALGNGCQPPSQPLFLMLKHLLPLPPGSVRLRARNSLFTGEETEVNQVELVEAIKRAVRAELALARHSNSLTDRMQVERCWSYATAVAEGLERQLARPQRQGWLDTPHD